MGLDPEASTEGLFFPTFLQNGRLYGVSGPLSVPVPEPSGIVLLLIGAAVVCQVRRKS